MISKCSFFKIKLKIKVKIKYMVWIYININLVSLENKINYPNYTLILRNKF
jgi:hypothetical protein